MILSTFVYLLLQVVQGDNPVLAFFVQFGGIGAASWALDAALFKWWAMPPRHDPDNSTKVLISWATPFVLVLIVYFGGVLLTQWPLDNNTLTQALIAAASGLAGAKLIFGGTTKAENATGRADPNPPEP